jgi:hypothetical protein
MITTMPDFALALQNPVGDQKEKFPIYQRIRVGIPHPHPLIADSFV